MEYEADKDTVKGSDQVNHRHLAAGLMAALALGATFAQPAPERARTVRIVGTGGEDRDDALLSRAVSELNAAGRGTLLIDGTVIVKRTHAFTAAVSLQGAAPDATIESRISNSARVFSWSSGFSVYKQARFPIRTTRERAAFFESSEEDLREGEWVALWSENQLTGVIPHYGHGSGQHPLELHCVHHWDAANRRAYVEGFVVDRLDPEANASGCRVPMLRNIVVRDLTFVHRAPKQGNYSTALYFNACENVLLDHVTFDRAGPGAIWFNFCADSTVRAVTVEGTVAVDGVYGFVAGAVNGLDIQAYVKGTRHAFTTTSSMSYNLSWPVESVDAEADALRVPGHSVRDGQAVGLEGKLPEGLAPWRVYWVVNAQPNVIQLADEPGGEPVDLGQAKGALRLLRRGRWGTPLGVRYSGKVDCSSKIEPGRPVRTRLAVDTHAEGWGIVFKDLDIYVGGDTCNIGAQTRSRNTVFDNVRVFGSGVSKGLRAFGANAIFRNCHVEGGWTGLGIYPAANRVMEAHRVRIDGCTFLSMTGPGVHIYGGEGHTITRCVFDRCGQQSTVNPFRPSAHIVVAGGARGVRIAQNDLPRRGTVQYSIAAEQIPPSELTVVGNTMDGYGPGRAGFGRTQELSTVDPERDSFTVEGAHGLADGDLVRFEAKEALAKPLNAGTDYRVLAVDKVRFRVEKASGAGAIDLTTAGERVVVVAGRRDALERAHARLNRTDP